MKILAPTSLSANSQMELQSIQLSAISTVTYGNMLGKLLDINSAYHNVLCICLKSQEFYYVLVKTEL